MMRLLVFNLATDVDDPVLGFTTAWLTALAARCETLDVITMRAGRLALPPHVTVYSLGKEDGYSEPRRAVRFYRLLIGLLWRNRYDAAFAHMTPLFAVMAAPLLKLCGLRVTVWYAHKHVGRMVRWAERVAFRVVSASRESFRLPSAKLRVLGHGVDTDWFAPQDHQPPRRQGEGQEQHKDHQGTKNTKELGRNSEPWRFWRLGGSSSFVVASVSRLSPVKRVEVIMQAVAVLRGRGVDARLLVAGEATDAAYGARLQQEAAGMGEAVTLLGGVPYEQVREVYHAADVMVNLSATGSIDKAILEAMACAKAVITSNDSFAPILAEWGDGLYLLQGQDTPQAVAERLIRLATLSSDERAKLGARLREIVVRDHSLQRLIERLIKVMMTGEPD